MKVCMGFAIVGLLCLLTGWLSESFSSDVDGNGFDDSLELTIARKFCPCFGLHSGSFVRPMPVSIVSMSHSFRSVPASALWHRFYDVQGRFVGDWRADAPGWPSYWYQDWWGSPDWNYSWITGPVDVVVNPPGDAVYGHYYSVPHVDWGGPEVDAPDEWYDLYRSQHGTQFGHPGQYYKTTVYAHLF